MPILDQHSIELISRSPDQTRRAGMRLGSLLNTHDVICLSGELGSGKTTFVQGISSGWGSHDLVTSPSFVMVNYYRRPDQQILYHLDVYRINKPAEIMDLDIDNIIDKGTLVIEWADRIVEFLPKDHLWIELHWVSRDQRDLLISAKGSRYEELLIAYRETIYGV